jgi:hypothetical protein
MKPPPPLITVITVITVSHCTATLTLLISSALTRLNPSLSLPLILFSVGGLPSYPLVSVLKLRLTDGDAMRLSWGLTLHTLVQLCTVHTLTTAGMNMVRLLLLFPLPFVTSVQWCHLMGE